MKIHFLLKCYEFVHCSWVVLIYQRKWKLISFQRVNLYFLTCYSVTGSLGGNTTLRYLNFTKLSGARCALGTNLSKC
jgi:hypothetical protein